MDKQVGFLRRVGTNFLGMMQDKDTPLRDRVLIVAGILYLISPIDLIPEGVMLLLGYGDDLAILLGTISLIRRNYKRYVEKQKATIIDVTDYKWKS